MNHVPLPLAALIDRAVVVYTVAGFLVLGLVGIVAALGLLMYSRWGRWNALWKCLAISVSAHVLFLLAGFLMMLPEMPRIAERIINVTFGESSPEPGMGKPGGAGQLPAAGKGPGRAVPSSRPWEAFGQDDAAKSKPVELSPQPVAELADPKHTPLAESGIAGRPPLEELVMAEPTAPEPDRASPAATPAKPPEESFRAPSPIQAPPPERREGAKAAGPSLLLDPPETPESSAAVVHRYSRQDLPPSLLQRPLTLPPIEDAAAGPPSGSVGPTGKPSTLLDILPRPAGSPESLLTAGGSDSSLLPGPAGLQGGPLGGSGPFQPTPLFGTGSPLGSGGDSVVGGLGGIGPPSVPPRPGGTGGGSTHSLPGAYRLRVAPNRGQIAEGLGATPQSELAVNAALRWLARNQEPDGRWDPRKHEAGGELRTGGVDRANAGRYADTGVSGLAVLAMSASGHTHLNGEFQENLRKALAFLQSQQAADGSLAGHAQPYEAMYCHGMATLALGEMAGMSGDQRLLPSLRRAVGFIVAAQDPQGGGWRYTVGSAGDTSQLGWQLMALKSAELAGVSVPDRTWRAARRYLDSVSSGEHRGLAAYRPGPGERVTPTMTAEALACRQFLGLTAESPTAREAGDYLMRFLPADRDASLYYWYYGTMATYQLQGDYWQRWNAALQKTLLARQVSSGPQAGSWAPETTWDNYGGRVYSTALAALCLEAFYRFFPEASGSTPTDRP